MEYTISEQEYTELKILREYMEVTFHNKIDNKPSLNPNRSTASYALEFLKTTHNNLKDEHNRNMLGVHIHDLSNYQRWIDEITVKATILTEKITEFQSLQNCENKAK